jgi:hypothetical protein
MLKNKVFYKNDVSDKILMVLPRASDKVLNNLKGLPLCELVTFETTPSLRLNQSQFLNIGSSLCSLLDIRSITISGILIASVEEIVNNLSIILLVE